MSSMNWGEGPSRFLSTSLGGRRTRAGTVKGTGWLRGPGAGAVWGRGWQGAPRCRTGSDALSVGARPAQGLAMALLSCPGPPGMLLFVVSDGPWAGARERALQAGMTGLHSVQQQGLPSGWPVGLCTSVCLQGPLLRQGLSSPGSCLALPRCLGDTVFEWINSNILPFMAV